ncbi:MAG: hypothetical protein AAFY33_11360 [Cyanobacteria bacterium J06643_4]
MVVSKNRLQNLFLDVQGSDSHTRLITVHNRGDHKAQIDLWLEPTEQKSISLKQWGIFDTSEAALTLEGHSSKKVVLTFYVPPQAEPGFYRYDLRISSSVYPAEDIRRSQQLEVSPSPQIALLRNEPKITITPHTSSDNPQPLEARQVRDFSLTVENPSRRTDRFFLECSDLDSSWFTVTYPESSAQLPGVVTYADGLQLNPGDTGNIKLQIHPPEFSPAGNYFPTFRLISRIREDIVILQVIYFTLKVDDQLAIALTPRIIPIPNFGENFLLTFVNRGNIHRHLVYQAQDAERILRYQLQPEEISLAPGEESTATIMVSPRQWWHRLWRLRERTVNVEVVVDNSVFVADEVLALQPWNPALPLPFPTGIVTLKQRRRWLFRLLVFLLSTSLLLAITWVIWHVFFWRPSLRPKVANFSTTRETYQVSKGPSILLDWELENYHNIDKIEIDYITPTEVVLETELTRTEMLASEKCFEESTIRTPSILATLLRGYRSLLVKLTKNKYPSEQISLRCQGLALTGLINPTGSTEVEVSKTEATETEATEVEVSKTEATETEAIELEEGLYNFRLTVFPLQESSGNDPSDVAVLEDVTVAPRTPPRIQTFRANSSEYRTAKTDESDLPIIPITLDWTISNPVDIQSIQLVSLAPDGSENTEPKPYDFKNGISSEIKDFCLTSTPEQLICNDVPETTVSQVGDYTFSLRVITDNGNIETPIERTAPMVSIKPPAPKILDFQVNGQNALTTPQQFYELTPARGLLELSLSWQVEHAKTIEILPALGVVSGTETTYSLSATPGTEIITLRVVNELGEETIQSVAIEKIEFFPGAQVPFAQPSVSVPPLDGQPSGAAPATEQNESGLPLPSLPVPDPAPIYTAPQAD